MGRVGHLLATARAGSTEALGEALLACQDYLLIVAQNELDPDLRSKGSASDLVSETFLEAHRDFAQFHGASTGELRAWLRQLLLNNVANFTRRYRATGKREVGREVSVHGVSSSYMPAAGLAARDGTPSGVAAGHEQSASLLSALEQLPADYCRVIVLRYHEQLPFEEIAKRMNRSANAVRIIWSRAVRLLRQLMEALDEPESKPEHR
jgi:RNA polymerase sigma-70 factor, ECF subfamily